jgi:hypothetical protein
MLVFPSLGSQARGSSEQTQRLRMSVEHHNLSGIPEEVNTFLPALRIFTSRLMLFLVPGLRPCCLALRYNKNLIWIKKHIRSLCKIREFNILR